MKIADPATSFIQLKEGHKIFSQKYGTGKIKLLLLHGGPFNTHEGFEIFIKQLPLDKFTIIWYDQLGSYYSDQPNDTTLWNTKRFVDEVEQVRQFYNLDQFYLLGHSWGGLLAIEYSLKYQEHLAGLILSNKSYSQQNLVQTRRELSLKIAEEIGLSIPLDSASRIKVDSIFTLRHMARLSPQPDALLRNRIHTRQVPRFIRNVNMKDRDNWNALEYLKNIKTPTLLIGSKNDFVKIDELEQMKKRIPNSKLYICPNGGHFDFWDDTKNYFTALKRYFKTTEKKYYR